MSLFRDLLRVSEINRIMRDRLDFICDVEVDESMYEPAELPRRVIKDRFNIFHMRPLEFRVRFGMSKEFFKTLLDMLTPQLARKNQNDTGNLLPIHRLAIFLQLLHKLAFTRVSAPSFTCLIWMINRHLNKLKWRVVQRIVGESIKKYQSVKCNISVRQR